MKIVPRLWKSNESLHLMMLDAATNFPSLKIGSMEDHIKKYDLYKLTISLRFKLVDRISASYIIKYVEETYL